MFARNVTFNRNRRGVVLVLILGMLGLLALVGVMFASSTGQQQISSRNFSAALQFPTASQVFDFGLSQLINDTDNPNSALRGHSLKRDMYGNDSSYTVRDPTTGLVLHVESNGYLANLPNPIGEQLFFLATRPNPSAGSLANFPQFRTNIPINNPTIIFPTLVGVNFNRWFVRLQPWFDPVANVYHASQTLEVVDDDATGLDAFSGGTDPITGLNAPMHLLTLAHYDGETGAPTSVYNHNTAVASPLALPTDIDQNGNPITFVLDGRFRRAFNGTGMMAAASYGNFRLNGLLLTGLLNMPTSNPLLPALGNPDMIGMDEDYDACDLENWYLAIQSADGQVVIPSFHRPGILNAVDWTVPYDPTAPLPLQLTQTQSAAKFLRPRAIDHNGNFATFPNLVPDVSGTPLTNPNFGRINYDVDNDGDGVTDAVWLDLGYPVQRDPSGRMFKPLFAFTVIGLNGRMPLNTVGNLQGRDVNGFPTWDHTSHLGYSVNEINPKFALQNAPDFLNGPLSLFSSQVDNPDLAAGVPQTFVGLTQLRNLLAGTRPQTNPFSPTGSTMDANYVYINGSPTAMIPGTPFFMPNGLADAGDLGTPVFRGTPPVAGRWGEPDGISSLLDPNVPMNLGWPAAAALYYYNPVRAGRSAYYPALNVDATDDDYDAYDFWGNTPELADHFDAIGSKTVPVERIRTFVTPIDPIGIGQVMPWRVKPTSVQGSGGFPDSGNGYDKLGRVAFFRYFRPAGYPVLVNNSTVAPFLTPPAGGTDRLTPAAPPPGTYPYLGTNLFHGYDSALNPPLSGQLLGAGADVASYNAAMPYFQANNARTVPNIDSATYVNINSSNWAAALNAYPLGSLNRDEADEMNLYMPNSLDAPFGFGDLEWLYRKHDVDGASLDSRLASLAPISFLNQFDGTTRRRLFSIDTWDTTNFVWAHDNPSGVFALNSEFQSFGPVVNPVLIIDPWIGNASDENRNVLGGGPPSATGSLAHRDRKINLNFPLPASNDPREPVRRKWITETYRRLKHVLPPQSTDQDAEKNQLSQFVINIVDFRDPDATMTMFTNPDTNEKQFGMEYTPVAINEVLAYSYVRQNSLSQQRFFVELVNTLTQDVAAAPGGPSDLSLVNWDFVIKPDDNTGRPDPDTGQVPNNTTYDPNGALMTATADYVPALTSADRGPEASGTFGATNYFYLFGNAPGANEVGTPTVQRTINNAMIALLTGVPNLNTTPMSSATSNGAKKYFWLYLRRPANPLAATDPVNNPMVVVDSIRFPFIEGSARDGDWGPDPANMGEQIPISVNNAHIVYSVERLQPYRGGHAVPGDNTAGANGVAYDYGFSEQVVPSQTTSTLRGRYLAQSGAIVNVTNLVRHTLGVRNSQGDPAWDYVPFHDRDFTSVAELLLVPGVPPGLFTKKFVELAPQANVPIFQANAVPVTNTTVPTAQAYTGNNPIFPNITPGTPPTPHSFPYLSDNFYYTATNDATNQVGGPNGAGWFKMFEFFEVPSSAMGAIGPAAVGNNFDWYREDLKPGLLNINLIIDQEVFLGLIDDPRIHTAPAAALPQQLPQIVTQVDPFGYPTRIGLPPNVVFTGAYPMSNRGLYYDEGNSTGVPNLRPIPGLTAAFSDFLKLRHGGSGFLFAWQSGPVGSGSAFGNPPPTVNTTPAAVERPFHSLSYPDIDYTIMRPATLPASAFTTPPLQNTMGAGYAADPGVKNSFIPSGAIPPVPPIPARRLFQIPDAANGSNASVNGQTYVNDAITHPDLNDDKANIFKSGGGNKVLLGDNDPDTATPPNGDMRQHPYFRTEILQKVMNLTTTRSHQFAVWITVGFVEVTRRGNPQLAIPDTLGQELRLPSGETRRFRSFFVIDRSRAFGFNCPWPGVGTNDFRDCVVYRRQIE
jgi:large repetitive protein